jgi:hypothetical protein
MENTEPNISPDWALDFEWLRVRHEVKDSMQLEVLPDLNAILLLIGIQEVGQWKKQYTKEEKQDLMHVAVCTLLTEDGYYRFEGRDADGWPHFQVVRAFEQSGERTQEQYLKSRVVVYFESHQRD